MLNVRKNKERKQIAQTKIERILSLYIIETCKIAIITNKHLKIMQYNIIKKQEVINSILNDTMTKDYTLFIIQEHYSYRKNSLLHQS